MQAGAPAPLFHPVEGRTDCAGCHSRGLAGARPLTSTHEAFTGVACVTCHAPVEGSLAVTYGGAALALGAFGVAVGLLLVRARVRGAFARAEALGDRARRVFSDAVLGRKLFSRPWIGAAHLGLVLGLAVLALGSLFVQLRQGVLVPRGHAPLGATGLALLKLVLDVSGTAVVAGATALYFFGRARARRAQGARAAVLGAIVLIAGSGFVLQGLRASLDAGAGSGPVGHVLSSVLAFALPDAPARTTFYQALWWAHLGLALGLLVLAPLSPLRHAGLAALHVAAAKPRADAALAFPFDLRELVASGKFDVRVGVGAAEDLGPTDRLGLLSCTACARCDDMCPSHGSGGPLSPSKLVGALAGAVLDRSAAAASPLVGGRIGSEELWACSQCGGCTEVCPVLLDPTRLVAELRRHVATNGRLDGSRADVLGKLSRTGNPYGLSAVTRRSLVNAGADEGTETLLWLGCAAVYDARVRKTTDALLGLLRDAGEEVAVLGAEESCCGDPARRIGEEGRFQELALANIAWFERRRVKRVITLCAHCYLVLARAYPPLGAKFEVVHHATLLHDLIASGKLRPERGLSAPIALHDACFVGRQSGQFEAPRATLRALPGAEIVELGRTRELAACCGGGGGAYFCQPPRAGESPAMLRVREALASGARSLAVECPFCLRLLEDAAAAVAARDPAAPVLVVRDLVEWVAATVPGHAPAPLAHDKEIAC